MSMFDDFVEIFVEGAKQLAGTAAKEFVDQLRTSAENFIRESEEDFKRWTGQLRTGKLTKLEFETLVRTIRGEAALRALTQAGIAKSKAQKLRDALIDLAINSAVKVFLP
jgi:hypothetical protein